MRARVIATDAIDVGALDLDAPLTEPVLCRCPPLTSVASV